MVRTGLAKKVSRLFATALLATTAGLGVSASPAYAEDPWNCPMEYMCFWQHANYEGLRFNLLTQDSTFHNNPCANCVSSKHPGSNGTWGDQASSYMNHSVRQYCFYRDVNYSGLLFIIQPYENGNLSGSMNDEASSARPC